MTAPADAPRGKARIIEKWRRRHARLQKQFEAAGVEDCGDPLAAESIRKEMTALALAIRRYGEERQGARRR